VSEFKHTTNVHGVECKSGMTWSLRMAIVEINSAKIGTKFYTVMFFPYFEGHSHLTYALGIQNGSVL